MTRKPILVALCLVVPLLGAADVARAQIMIPPGASPLSPPPPPPPPPPSMAVPVVPKFDAPPQQSRAVGSARQRSFGDRITDCLQDGAAAGLSPGRRAAYSRACANQ
jgi:hypothetical protein